LELEAEALPMFRQMVVEEVGAAIWELWLRIPVWNSYSLDCIRLS